MKEKSSNKTLVLRKEVFVPVYSSRLEISEAEHGKPCIAGRLRVAEGYCPYRLRV
ncbi:MAG: hypothetical protein FWC50_12395 [Planctomycetaceae bacterium]|nr:hypothetical protein [Planctomycetaceae bacterium]